MRVDTYGLLPQFQNMYATLFWGVASIWLIILLDTFYFQ